MSFIEKECQGWLADRGDSCLCEIICFIYLYLHLACLVTCYFEGTTIAKHSAWWTWFPLQLSIEIQILVCILKLSEVDFLESMSCCIFPVFFCFFFLFSPFTRPHRETLFFQNAELTVRDSDSLAGPLVAVLNKWIITHWPKINFLTRSFIASLALHPFLGCNNNLNVESSVLFGRKFKGFKPWGQHLK